MALFFDMLFIVAGAIYVVYKAFFPEGFGAWRDDCRRRNAPKPKYYSLYQGLGTKLFEINAREIDALKTYFRNPDNLEEVWTQIEDYKKKYPDYCRVAKNPSYSYGWEDVGSSRISLYGAPGLEVFELYLETFGKLGIMVGILYVDKNPAWWWYIWDHLGPPYIASLKSWRETGKVERVNMEAEIEANRKAVEEREAQKSGKRKRSAWP